MKYWDDSLYTRIKQLIANLFKQNIDLSTAKKFELLPLPQFPPDTINNSEHTDTDFEIALLYILKYNNETFTEQYRMKQPKNPIGARFLNLYKYITRNLPHIPYHIKILLDNSPLF